MLVTLAYLSKLEKVNSASYTFNQVTILNHSVFPNKWRGKIPTSNIVKHLMPWKLLNN